MVDISTAAGKYLNPSYQIILKTPDLDVTTFIPESFAITLDSQWETVLKNFIDTLASGFGDKLKNLTTQSLDLLGYKTIFTQMSSFPSWTGNSPLDFSIPFHFEAISNAKKDVYDKTKYLAKLVTPSLAPDGVMLYAPGPYLDWNIGTNYKNAMDNLQVKIANRHKCSLRIGRFMYIDEVIITDVSTTYYSRFDINGFPMAADTQVKVRTVFPPTQTDIEKWFSADMNYSQTAPFNLRDIAANLKEGISQGLDKLGSSVSEYFNPGTSGNLDSFSSTARTVMSSDGSPMSVVGG